VKRKLSPLFMQDTFGLDKPVWERCLVELSRILQSAESGIGTEWVAGEMNARLKPVYCWFKTAKSDLKLHAMLRDLVDLNWSKGEPLLSGKVHNLKFRRPPDYFVEHCLALGIPHDEIYKHAPTLTTAASPRKKKRQQRKWTDA